MQIVKLDKGCFVLPIWLTARKGNARVMQCKLTYKGEI